MKTGTCLVLALIIGACGEGIDQTGPEAEARADLAMHLDVGEASIEIVSTEQVTWSDGSLGCPEPGMFYTQALVEGTRIILEHDGRFFAYHSGADNEPFLCASDDEDGGHDGIPPLEGAV